jgi:hypothetical protein
LWEPEPEPKNIYYFGQSKNFEEWCKTRIDQGTIYKEFEEKSTFTKHIFKERDYDKSSIWKYDDDDDNIIIEIEKIINIKNDLNNNIDYLIKKFDDLKNDNNNNNNEIDEEEIIKINKKIEKFENIHIKKFLKKLNY